MSAQVPCFLKLKIVQTLFTKRMAFSSSTISRPDYISRFFFTLIKKNNQTLVNMFVLGVSMIVLKTNRKKFVKTGWRKWKLFETYSADLRLWAHKYLHKYRLWKTIEKMKWGKNWNCLFISKLISNELIEDML